MKKKISLDNIGFIIIILTIILLNIFIGSNVKNPIWIVQFIVSAYTAIYVLINIIKKKKINKKIIIAIIIFIILFFIYFFIAIRIGKPAQITGEEKTFVIRNFEPNKQYEFTMDIDAESDIMGVVIGTIMAETIILVYETISVRNKLNIKKFIKAFLNFLVKGIIMFVIIYSMRNIIDNKIILIVMQCVVGFAIYILLNKKYVFSIIR